MDSQYHWLFAALTALLFVCAKWMENRSVSEEDRRPLKYTMRDTAFVFGSVLVGQWIMQQLFPLMQPAHTTPVFTDAPEF